MKEKNLNKRPAKKEILKLYTAMLALFETSLISLISIILILKIIKQLLIMRKIKHDRRKLKSKT